MRSVLLDFYIIDLSDVKESGMVKYGIGGPSLRDEGSDLPVIERRLMLLRQAYTPQCESRRACHQVR